MNEPEVTPQTFPKYAPNPIFNGLPEYLKDPANYDKIQKEVLDTLASTHSHGEVLEWASCASCQQRFTEHGMFIEKLGFKSPRQYMAWKKVMWTMMNKTRNPLI